jgi:hypothetical protein
VLCHDVRRWGLPLPRWRRVPGDGVQPLPRVEPLSASAWGAAAGALTPGDACWGAFPGLEADCCTRCLATFAPHYAARLPLGLREQALAHGAQRLQWPEPVVLVWFPASSPALPPVERRWEDLQSRSDVVETRG